MNNHEHKFYEEEVFYQNKSAGVKLAGTLTMPSQNGLFPAVILIAGYGPNDRDYTIGQHKRFKFLAEHLTAKGLAVLRFDKRGAGKSTGNYKIATSSDFADDVFTGIKYLKTRTDINPKKIGLIGHSEGGMLGCMVAAESKDIAFLVSMAGIVQTDVKDLVIQTAKQLKADGANKELLDQDYKLRTQMYKIIKEESNVSLSKTKLQELMQDYWNNLPDKLRNESNNIPFAITGQKIDGMIEVFNSPWYRYFFKCNPVEMLKKIKAPVLAIYGDCDWIASADPSLKIIADTLKAAGNNNYKTIEIPNLNHTFQTCKTGSMAEYNTIEETISPVVLKTISDWILKKI